MINEAVCIEPEEYKPNNFYIVKQTDINNNEHQIKLQEIKTFISSTDSNIKNLVDTSSLLKNDILIINDSIHNMIDSIKKNKNINIMNYIFTNELCVSTNEMKSMLEELEESYKLLQETFLSIKNLSNQIN